MRSTHSKPAYPGHPEGVPVGTYSVIRVFAVGLFMATLLQSAGKDNHGFGGDFGSSMSTEKPSKVPKPPPVEAPGGFGPPAELIVRQKAYATESQPLSLEPAKQCYWLDKNAAPARWVPVKVVYRTELSKQSCFELDSCDGGRGRSHGDCYKWAATPTAERDPWMGG